MTYVLGAPLGVGSAHRRPIDLGPDHPSRSGLVEIACSLEGDLIVEAQVRPGASHRSAEKLFEVRDYRQLLALANRHDWQAPFAGELGAALTIEDALRLTPAAPCHVATHRARGACPSAQPSRLLVRGASEAGAGRDVGAADPRRSRGAA
jgi:hypothetical protein